MSDFVGGVQSRRAPLLAVLLVSQTVGLAGLTVLIAATGVLVPVLAGVAGGERPAALQVAGILAAVLGLERYAEPAEEGAGGRHAGAHDTIRIVLADWSLGELGDEKRRPVLIDFCTWRQLRPLARRL